MVLCSVDLERFYCIVHAKGNLGRYLNVVALLFRFHNVCLCGPSLLGVLPPSNMHGHEHLDCHNNSKTSLNRATVGPTLSGPLREVVGLRN